MYTYISYTSFGLVQHFEPFRAALLLGYDTCLNYSMQILDKLLLAFYISLSIQEHVRSFIDRKKYAKSFMVNLELILTVFLITRKLIYMVLSTPSPGAPYQAAGLHTFDSSGLIIGVNACHKVFQST